ncbi:mucin-2 protein [Nocardioides sp. YIM 152315]|uniref:mucin-2 protein n=1 Tax=Nocardioides sp. YIM 152315 TaxID=3031760 RepID=UPI0023DBF5D4|nr:mucin-2 protein [Nocardioides sp. YIM 152315]MDF1603836.1 mucin-2 protein [Nocardioides sp. YIM 152315]
MAEHRHKRETSARRLPRAALVAAPIALLATGSAVTLGVVSSDPVPDLPVAQDAASVSGAARESTASRSESRLDTRKERKAFQKAVDRSARVVATRSAVRTADTRRWTTEVLNLWTGSGEFATKDGEMKSAKRVLVTGRRASGRVEIVVDGNSRWVSEGYLSEEKPVAAAAGLSMAPCPDPGVEGGLTDDAVYVYRSVCHAFPQITSYGGWDAHGEHSSGRALDIMTSDVELGDAIAAFLQEHAAELNLYDILWRQRIWTPVRAGEGWRSMSSRGSATANHYDHVHVATNG